MITASESNEIYLPIYAHTANPAKRSFGITENGTSGSFRRDELVPYNLKYVLRHPAFHDLYKIDPDRFLTLAFTGVKTKGSTLDMDTEYPELEPFPLGEIVCIPEPGHKIRVVCQPHLIWNSLAFPLGRRLKEINSQWAVQGVDSHEKCVSFLREKLISNKLISPRARCTFYSIDMRNFTDRLPYKGLQDQVLMGLVKRGFIREFDKILMDRIFESDYQHPFQKGMSIRYGVGTPQGTYPSFPLCSLTNGVLLYLATLKAQGWKVSEKIHLRKDDLPGRIIGDDTVIWDDIVALKYNDIMKELGVEISTTKSLSSQSMIEMCSKVIHPYEVYLQKKMKTIDTLSSVVSNYNYYGSDLQDLLPEGEEILDVLRKIPKPYGLGREITDLVGSPELTTYEQVFLALHMYGSLDEGRPQPLLKRGEWALIRRRKQLLPPIQMGEVDCEVSSFNQTTTVLLESLHQSLDRAFKRLIKECELTTKLELAASVISLSKVILAFQDKFSLKGKTPPRESGLMPPESRDRIPELIGCIDRQSKAAIK
jgi:hypothetical protein